MSKDEAIEAFQASTSIAGGQRAFLQVEFGPRQNRGYSGSITVDTNGSSFDTLLSVYQGSCPFDAAELVGCDDDSGTGLASSITFNAVEGQTYAIRVGGFGNAAGLVFLGVSTCTAACPADYNHDGGVDGDDVIAFFGDWDSGNIAADFNNDTGVDGDDVIQFFEHWDAGC